MRPTGLGQLLGVTYQAERDLVGTPDTRIAIGVVQPPLGFQQRVGGLIGIDGEGEAPSEDVVLGEVVVDHAAHGVYDAVERFRCDVNME